MRIYWLLLPLFLFPFGCRDREPNAAPKDALVSQVIRGKLTEKEILTRYLAATTPRKRLPYVDLGDCSEKDFLHRYSNHDWGAGFELLTMKKVGNNAFDISFVNQKTDKELYNRYYFVKKTGKLLIDWERSVGRTPGITVEYFGKSRLHHNLGKTPMAFWVYAKLGDYWGYGFGDQRRWVCIEFHQPNGPTFHAYVLRNSEVADSMIEHLTGWKQITLSIINVQKEANIESGVHQFFVWDWQPEFQRD